MNTAPRHLAPAPADTGRSYIWDALTAKTPEPKHARHSPRTAHNPYRDPWAGHPDTEKHWGKNR